MSFYRQWLLAALLAGTLAGSLEARPVEAQIDASRKGQPISKLVFGGFMEPATTRAWAEMLYDRKFFFAINSKPAPAVAAVRSAERGSGN